MNARTYQALTVHADRWLLRPMPDPFVLGRDALPRGVSAAIYIVETRFGEVLYVGKTGRGEGRDAVAERIREHMRETNKGAMWHQVYVIPLRAETPNRVIEIIEGVVASDLHPTWSDIHPSAWLR
jgi:hypothetical protein